MPSPTKPQQLNTTSLSLREQMDLLVLQMPRQPQRVLTPAEAEAERQRLIGIMDAALAVIDTDDFFD